jgi:UDPglucose 6-dehydrogenase
MRIAVIGSGYVGLVSAACFADMGHDVISVDSDVAKIAALERGETPIHEEFLPELLARHRGARLKFSTSVADAVKKSEVIFITVGTPQSETGEADLSYVEAVAREVGPAIQEPKVVVEKSTVPVKTAESLRNTLLLSGARPGTFSVVSNPEFLREGTAVTDFLYPDRIVVGADDEISAAVMDAVYRPLTQGSYYEGHPVPFEKYAHDQAPIIMTDTKSAELIKHASNAFLAMKISFINAVANIAERVGADIQEICKGMGSDSRIGSRFLNAGIGYGGSCFPKDVQAFNVVARQVNYEFGLLTEVMRINADQRRRFLKKVKSALWTLRGKKVGVFGLAFKCDTDDIRESPALSIIESLLAEGAQVQVYDPAAMDNAKTVLGDTDVVFAKNAYEAAKGCDALLILTEWREFSDLDLAKIRAALKHPIVIDGRNLYAPQLMADAGFIYHSIGRSTGVPNHLSAATSGELRLRSAAVNPETMSVTAGI